MKHFALKFIDIMIGIVLGLGFQWWPELHEPWQYAAFFFAYLSIIDYWIDYTPALRKFPPKSEVDLMADVGILFTMFLLIYAAQLTIVYFLTVFAIFRAIDLVWMLRIRYEYVLGAADRIFFDTWFRFEIIEAAVAGVAAGLTLNFGWPAATILIAFIVFRITMRALASFTYKKVHFV